MTTTTIRGRTAALAGACAALALTTGAAWAQGTTRVDQGIDIAPFCGTEPIRIAHIDGYGADTWRKITRAELADEAAKCPNITEIAYTDAGGDPQAYNAAINGYVAQGYDIIIAFTDFGDAALPAYRAAHEAGITMVPYFNDISGEAGVDYAVNPYQDSFAVGRQFAEWLGASGVEGGVVMLGGTPGSASSTVFMDGFKDGLAAYPALTLLDENYIVTNWNPADAQRAVTGLIAQYPDIAAIASDYGVTSLGGVKAFQQAGLPVPAMASIATSNEYNCLYVESVAAGNSWPYLALDGSTADIRFALRHALATHNGIAIDEPLGVVPYTFADSVAGVEPRCSETAPPDADMSSLLPEDQLNALFQQ